MLAVHRTRHHNGRAELTAYREAYTGGEWQLYVAGEFDEATTGPLADVLDDACSAAGLAHRDRLLGRHLCRRRLPACAVDPSRSRHPGGAGLAVDGRAPAASGHRNRQPLSRDETRLVHTDRMIRNPLALLRHAAHDTSRAAERQARFLHGRRPRHSAPQPDAVGQPGSPCPDRVSPSRQLSGARSGWGLVREDPAVALQCVVRLG